MTFEHWLIYINTTLTDNEKVIAKAAWEASAKVESIECANICEERAKKCALQADKTNDQDDRTELKANAWQFSVLGAEIRKRSNVKLRGFPIEKGLQRNERSD
jgi:hypothetical protein